MPLTVEVLREDILVGQRGSVDRCPVARALRRATGLCAFVDSERFVIGCPDRPYRAAHDARPRHLLPPPARQFVRLFDAGLQVYPFVFVADVGAVRRGRVAP